MLAFLYLVIIFIVGDAIARRAFPWLYELNRGSSVTGTAINLPSGFVVLPVSWLVGAMTLNWLAFAIANYTRQLASGLYAALAVGAVASVIAVFFTIRRRQWSWPLRRRSSLLCIETAYFLFAVLISGFIACYTLLIDNHTLMVGTTVFSDFGPHLAMIRSFSEGENFPPQYPHFPDGSLRYHFMFQFLVASLEFLGLPLDWAFNLPSMLSLIGLFLLLYGLAVRITGSRSAGVLTGILFIFRSSFAFFSFVKDHLASDDVWSSLWNVALHIGKTEHENWGLWAQNVYANQRHFAFSICVMIIVLLSVLPLLEAMIARLRPIGGGREVLWARVKIGWFAKEAWWPQDWRRAMCLGLLLGALAFWNGAVVITTLLILLVLTLFSHHRLEFLIIAVLTAALTMLQQHWFMGGGAAAVKPNWYFGFLAEVKTITGTLAFYLELLGLFLPLFLISLFGTPKGIKALAGAFIAPLIFASLVSLTTDINANHKFIMIAVMLSNIPIAYLLARMLCSVDNGFRALAVGLLMLLTVTGWVDLKTLYNMNQNRYSIALDNPVSVWVRENSKPGDVFLTDWAVLHPVQMAGRPIYYGWPYYAWSAGYDTDRRFLLVKAIYTAHSREFLLAAVRQAGIHYIVIDNAVRNWQEFSVNEYLIGQTFPEVFRHDLEQTRIFAVE